MNRRAALLDRDGTIIEDTGYICDPDAVRLLPGAAQSLARLSEQDIPLVVVTNQSGVGRGYFSMAAVHAVNARLDALLTEHGVAIERYYICPHLPDDDCDCRKPRSGLALRAASELSLDLAASIVFGDKASDIGLGRSIGAFCCQLGEPNLKTPPDAFARDWPGLGFAVEKWLAERAPIQP